MKFRALVIAVFVMAFGAVVAHAAPSQSFGIGGGLSMPTGDASDAVETGFHAGGTYTYKMNEQFGLGGDVFYHMFGEKTFDDGSGFSAKAKLSAIQFGVHGKYYFPMKDAKMSPYLKVGVGMYNLRDKFTVTTDSTDPFDQALAEALSGTQTDSKFGFNGGVGSTWGMGDKASFGVEVLYHMISTEGQSTNLFTAAVNYNWMMGK